MPALQLPEEIIFTWLLFKTKEKFRNRNNNNDDKKTKKKNSSLFQSN